MDVLAVLCEHISDVNVLRTFCELSRKSKQVVLENVLAISSNIDICIPMSMLMSFKHKPIINGPIYVSIDSIDDVIRLAQTDRYFEVNRTLRLFTTKTMVRDILIHISLCRANSISISPYSNKTQYNELVMLFLNDSDIGYGVVNLEIGGLILSDLTVTDGIDLTGIINTKPNTQTIVCPGSIPIPLSRTFNIQEGVTALLISAQHMVREEYMLSLDVVDPDYDLIGLRVGITNPFIIFFVLLLSIRDKEKYRYIGNLISLALTETGIKDSKCLFSDYVLDILFDEIVSPQNNTLQLSSIVKGYPRIMSMDAMDIMENPMLDDIVFPDPIRYPLMSRDLVKYNEMEIPFDREDMCSRIEPIIVDKDTIISDLVLSAERMIEFYREFSVSNGILTGRKGHTCTSTEGYYNWGELLRLIRFTKEVNISVSGYIDLFR